MNLFAVVSDTIWVVLIGCIFSSIVGPAVAAYITYLGVKREAAKTAEKVDEVKRTLETTQSAQATEMKEQGKILLEVKTDVNSNASAMAEKLAKAEEGRLADAEKRAIAAEVRSELLQREMSALNAKRQASIEVNGTLSEPLPVEVVVEPGDAIPVKKAPKEI